MRKSHCRADGKYMFRVVINDVQEFILNLCLEIIQETTKTLSIKYFKILQNTSIFLPPLASRPLAHRLRMTPVKPGACRHRLGGATSPRGGGGMCRTGKGSERAYRRSPKGQR